MAPPNRSRAASECVQGVCLLVVDDTPDDLRFLLNLLSREGYSVRGAPDSRTALQAMSLMRPDLVLLDVCLPRLDGHLLSRYLRRNPRTADVPILYTCPPDEIDEDLHGPGEHTFDFLTKPFHPREVLVRVRTHINLLQTRRHLESLLVKRTDEVGSKTRKLEAERRQRQQAAHALEASERKYRQIFNATGEAILICDLEGRILAANRTLYRLLRVAPKALLNRLVDTALPCQGEEEHALLREALERAAAGDGDQVTRCRIRPRGGKETWLEISARRADINGHARLMLVARDISSRVRADFQARLLREALEHAAEGIVITDAAGQILYANPHYEGLLGYSRGELLGRRVSILDPEHFPRRDYEALRNALDQGRPWSGTCVEQRRDGELIEEEVTIAPVPGPGGGPDNLVLVKRDVTGRKKLEGQILLERKMEAIRGLAAGFANDFNNLLAAILGCAEICLEAVPRGGPLADNLGQILDSAHRARRLVRQLLSISRQEEAERFPVNIHPLVYKAVNTVRQEHKNPVRIYLDVDPRCGPVRADPARIQFVVEELCRNALAAMEGDEEALRVSMRAQALEDDHPLARMDPRPGSYLRIEVADTGRGMEDEVLARIFEPFFTTRGDQGAKGLGLTRVHAIVREHEGYVSATSEPGLGAVFTVYLPLVPESAEQRGEPSPPRPAPRQQRSLTTDGMRVLIVDDEEVLTMLESRTLEQHGFQVTACNDPRDALERFRRDPRGFDLLITDQAMPHMTGAELLAEVLELRPDMPVILCTGFSESIDEKQALALGARAFMLKPVSAERFISKVRQVLHDVQD